MTSSFISQSPDFIDSTYQARPVFDSYHGVEVEDQYRWLEQGDSPEVRAWTEAQNHKTRVFLDAIPDRTCIHDQLATLFDGATPSYSGLVSRPGRVFARKFQPPNQQSLLVSLASVDDVDSETIVLDPNLLEPLGQVAIDWFVPSPDGELLAVCLSEYGSEEGSLHFYQTKTGIPLPDRITDVQFPTGGGSATWAPDGKSIFYTRYSRAGERRPGEFNFYQQVYRHKMGSLETDDVYSVGREFPRIALIQLETSRDGRWFLASVANGDGGEYAHYVMDFEGREPNSWRQLTRFEDGIKGVAFGCDGATIFLRSVKDAPRGKILSLPLDGSVALEDAAVVIPEGSAVIENFIVTPSHLYIAELVGGPSRIGSFKLAGGEHRQLPIAEGCGITDLVGLADGRDDGRLIFRQTSFTEPDSWWMYDPAACCGFGELRKTALSGISTVDFTDMEVLREFAVSKDGTRVPVNIVRRKGTRLDGNNPTLLHGYGGYGHSMRPQFNCALRLWFDLGGVFVVANLRGGGEYGKEWHLNGNLTRKQNVFDDFAACAQHLINRGYTRSAKLAVEGRSNGGLLMGAFLTQHPDLVGAVVAHVGMYDMLRVELDSNGTFNIPEFGTVEIAEQFQALHAYSPYHRVTDGTGYPTVLLLAGEKDGRVNPAHSRKMAARLQDANASGNPVLVRLSSDSGHGMGTALAERISATADVFAFLYDALGMKDEMDR